MSDLIPRPLARQLMIPGSGEAVDLDAPSTDLAGHLRNITTFRNALSGVSRSIQDEILWRQDRDAAYTTRAGSLKLVGDSPDRDLAEYDVEGLREALWVFVEDGRFSLAALDKALRPTYKADKRGLKALRGLGVDVAGVIDAHARSVRARGVRVEENGR